jgi:bifunctional UDP-N-acetylglucosamine pyrophosphorylase/glucosamine-1-phosphate N-acetyltransferase/UDP-N-acetylglucosamine pyrophosphorylase
MAKARAVVLAAGKGTRMKSDLPKVLVPVCGRPMVEFVLDMLVECGIEQTLVVVGYRSDLVRTALANRRGLTFVEQTEQLGTGHAVMVCREQLAGFTGPVVIVTGDSPLVRAATINRLLAEFERTQPACLLGTARKGRSEGPGPHRSRRRRTVHRHRRGKRRDTRATGRHRSEHELLRV